MTKVTHINEGQYLSRQLRGSGAAPKSLRSFDVVKKVYRKFEAISIECRCEAKAVIRILNCFGNRISLVDAI